MSIKANTPAGKFTGKDRAHYIQNSKEADMNFKKPSRKDQSVNKITRVFFTTCFMCLLCVKEINK